MQMNDSMPRSSGLSIVDAFRLVTGKLPEPLDLTEELKKQARLEGEMRRHPVSKERWLVQLRKTHGEDRVKR